MLDTGTISDGYHTFDELYEHRHALFVALCRMIGHDHLHPVWRSRLHADGTMYDGWFVMGIGRGNGEQITYHLPADFWDTTDFVRELPTAPPFDGHESDDVIRRLLALRP